MHSVSEDIFSRLTLLEADLMCRIIGGAKGVVPPPVDTLRVLHPLYFADAAVMASAGAGGEMRIHSDEAQKRQLGVFMHVGVERLPFDRVAR